MNSRDLHRITRGLGKVLGHVVDQSRPETMQKLSRIQLHFIELLAAIADTQHSSSDPYHTHNIKNTSSSPDVDGSISPMPPPVTPPRDPIGFPSKSNADLQAANAIRPPPVVNSKFKMQERAVPSTQFQRMVGFGSLAFKLAINAAADNAGRIMTGGASGRTISDHSAEQLAEALCKMRGAALKLGQILSLQDEGMLPEPLAKALERVRQAADYMPKHQLERQLVDQLGQEWRGKFADFEEMPIAAASIGQVHRATLIDGSPVAVKIQYPGVAESIDSDLQNLKRIVQMTNLLPSGLFVDQIVRVASIELVQECNYVFEAESQMRYRELILADPVLRKHTVVPDIISELSTSRILTSRFVHGVPIDKASELSQAVRDAIARTMLILTIKELFEWRFIQSDPNFANFLYDDSQQVINMIDFGAAREYKKEFVDGYMKLVWAAANRDSETILHVSKELGFLTGDESHEMTSAHVAAGLVIGEPFVDNAPFDFSSSRLTARIGKYGDTFMKYRLTPPPQEAYSLHRKLAGAFLLCIKLRAKINCRDILEETYNSYKFT